MLPGHDTTASALAWTLYSLAEHPHFQRQCQQEIDSLLQDRNTDDITWSVAHFSCVFELLRAKRWPLPYNTATSLAHTLEMVHMSS